MPQLSALTANKNFLTGTNPPLPPSLSVCRLAEQSSGKHFCNRKGEGNCFSNAANAPSTCSLTSNQCK
ncbi:unnamed protein product [Cylindrotheca closterium]|uniref:Uncharacterized protein n=1 Tax=Cylindrotheca closterium TaxID=2856 RepID=A0AAD2GBY5_9STRA|nr:unnamed protein product [Cylindrotheca closterium]